MPKKRSSLSPSSSSSPEGGVGALWLDVHEDGELKGGTKLMVTVNKMDEGKGRSKRTRYRSTVTLHGADELRISGLKHFRPTHSSDPRYSEDAKEALVSAAMEDFQRQKRERDQRDACNLEDTDEDDHGGAYLVCCCPSQSFSLVPLFTSSVSLGTPCLLGVLSVSPKELEAQVDGTGRYERGPREPRTVTAHRLRPLLALPRDLVQVRARGRSRRPSEDQESPPGVRRGAPCRDLGHD